MNVIGNILGKDPAGEELSILYEDLEYARSSGDKSAVRRIRQRIDGLRDIPKF